METTTAVENLSDQLEQMHVDKRYTDAFMPLVVIWSIMMAVGVTGNVIVLLVFSLSKEYKYKSYKVFVMFLAFFDLIACCTMIPIALENTQTYFYLSSKIFCKLKCFLKSFFIMLAATSRLAICVERSRKVHHPQEKHTHPKLAMKFVIVGFMFALLASVPALITCQIKPQNETIIDNITTFVSQCTIERNINQNDTFTNIYSAGKTAIHGGMSISFIVMYALIGRSDFRHVNVFQRHRHSKSDPENAVVKDLANSKGEGLDAVQDRDNQPNLQSRNSSGSQVENEENVNLPHVTSEEISQQGLKKVPYKSHIWLIVTVIFIVSILLHLICLYAKSDRYQMSPEALAKFKFLIRSYFFNHIINPIIYACFDRRFLPAIKNLVKDPKNRVMGHYKQQDNN